MTAGLALLLSFGGFSAGFVDGERARVWFLLALATTIAINAYLHLCDLRVAHGFGAYEALCSGGLIVVAGCIAVSAYLCLAARFG